MQEAFAEFLGERGWIPFLLDRSDRHYINQRRLRRDFGKMPQGSSPGFRSARRHRGVRPPAR